MVNMSQEGLVVAALFSICLDVLKSDNLLNKWGFVDSQSVTTVLGTDAGEVNLNIRSSAYPFLTSLRGLRVTKDAKFSFLTFTKQLLFKR